MHSTKLYFDLDVNSTVNSNLMTNDISAKIWNKESVIA